MFQDAFYAEEEVDNNEGISSCYQDEMISCIEALLKKLNCSYGCAADIVYERARTSWEESKRNYKK